MKLSLIAVGLVGCLAVGCGGAAGDDAVSSTDDLESDAARATDPTDGTPVHKPCTSSFGSNLTAGSFGRLDGTVVAIVPPGARSCNGDAHHIHLQIQMQGAIYDVAVNVSGVEFDQTDAALVGGAWSEGWHSNVSLDYPTSLGLHAANFATVSEAALTTQVEGLLAQANHVSVFATKYSRGGIHLTHRNGSGHDGAVVIHALSSPAHYLLFSFPRLSF